MFDFFSERIDFLHQLKPAELPVITRLGLYSGRSVFVTTKVARHDGGNYIVSSENQYPVFRGLAEKAQFNGIPGEAGQVAHL